MVGNVLMQLIVFTDSIPLVSSFNKWHIYENENIIKIRQNGYYLTSEKHNNYNK